MSHPVTRQQLLRKKKKKKKKLVGVLRPVNWYGYIRAKKKKKKKKNPSQSVISRRGHS